MTELTLVSVLALICGVAMTTAYDPHVGVAVPYQNKYLDVKELVTFNSDVMDCIAKCKQWISKLCKSVNYGYRGHSKRKCKLLDETMTSKPGQLKDHGEWLYYEINHVNAVSDRKELTKAEQDERKSSPMSVCYTKPCLHNATCEDICGQEKLKCLCRQSNSDPLCKTWKGSYSDFDLYFPGDSTGNYVIQTFKDVRYTDGIKRHHHHFTLSAWVYPEDGQNQSPIVSFVDGSSTILRVVLIPGTEFRKLSVYFGVKNFKRFDHQFQVAVKKWTFIRINIHTPHKQSTRLKVSTYHNGNNQEKEQGGFNRGGGIPDSTMVLIGRDITYPDRSFKGTITRLNIWSGNNDQKSSDLTSDALVAWPMFWDFYGPRVNGFVVKLPYSEQGKEFEVVPAANFSYTVQGIETVTKNVSNNRVTIRAEFVDIPCDDVSYLSVTVTTSGSVQPKRIKYRQAFLGKVGCYGVFGATLRDAPQMNDTGLYPFDPSKDKMSDASGSTLISSSAPNTPYGSFSSCGKQHFWDGSQGPWVSASVTQRCKPNAKSFTITTYVKCGTGSIVIQDLNLMK